jgi:hypothetical protein
MMLLCRQGGGVAVDKTFVKFILGISLISLASLTFGVALGYECTYMFWSAVSFIVIAIAMFCIVESISSCSIGLGMPIVLRLFLTSTLSRTQAFLDSEAWSGFNPEYRSVLIGILTAGFLPFIFACLGVVYSLMEVTLIQKLALLLGLYILWAEG